MKVSFYSINIVIKVRLGLVFFYIVLSYKIVGYLFLIFHSKRFYIYLLVINNYYFTLKITKLMHLNLLITF